MISGVAVRGHRSPSPAAPAVHHWQAATPPQLLRPCPRRRTGCCCRGGCCHRRTGARRRALKETERGIDAVLPGGLRLGDRGFSCGSIVWGFGSGSEALRRRAPLPIPVGFLEVSRQQERKSAQVQGVLLTHTAHSRRRAEKPRVPPPMALLPPAPLLPSWPSSSLSAPLTRAGLACDRGDVCSSGAHRATRSKGRPELPNCCSNVLCVCFKQPGVRRKASPSAKKGGWAGVRQLPNVVRSKTASVNQQA